MAGLSAERRVVLLERVRVLDEVLFALAAGESEVSISTGNASGSGSVTYRATDEAKIERRIRAYRIELGEVEDHGHRPIVPAHY